MDGKQETSQVDVTSSQRGLASQFIGTAILFLAVVVSGIQATLPSPHGVGFELLESALATAAILLVIITICTKESGAHFSPSVTVLSAVKDTLKWDQATIQFKVKLAGAITVTLITDIVFGVSKIHFSTHVRQSSPHFVSEVAATFLLIMVIEFSRKTYSATPSPALVAALIGAAYFVTSFTSFANLAAIKGRTPTTSFADISPRQFPLS